jgi:hypothetical protein
MPHALKGCVHRAAALAGWLHVVPPFVLRHSPPGYVVSPFLKVDARTTDPLFGA